MTFRRGGSSAHRLPALCALLLSLAAILLTGPFSAWPGAAAPTAAEGRPAAPAAALQDAEEQHAEEQHDEERAAQRADVRDTSAEQPPGAPSRCSGLLPEPEPALAPAPTSEYGHAPSCSSSQEAGAADSAAGDRARANGWRDRPAATLSQLSVLRI
ncbi:hypothetical protein MTQ01_05970 [Streptomyces sp. XM4193]|uniref:hypothetical protein n=1 Tax=Streptomyces sp. XM4193 TaxID=2929782 RepID=UPI001FFB9598|nr:hypothetical protein [Streptomyces sp. XM4193]MCK1795561.1 hypothetical protein [Streptomyces sp. XM4193]